MNLCDLDLNLLRIFDAVYQQRSVSRAAEVLGLSQPAVSHGLTRLRLLLGDALFVRVAGGVAPTAKADALADAVGHALRLIEEALHATGGFDPARARKTFRIHMSDIGEGVFLPALMHAVRRAAPGVRIETHQLEYAQIQDALDTGKVDLAFGYLPGVDATERCELLHEKYVVLARADHPLLREPPTRQWLARLDYIVVRQHTETSRVLHTLALQDNIRLSIPHFMVIPSIVRETDLAVILPRRTALTFARDGTLKVVEPDMGLPDFTVALHWSHRFHNDPGNRWLRETAIELFGELDGRTPRAPTFVEGPRSA
jgi:DNA-binding transcriptional LysR family regulator